MVGSAGRAGAEALPLDSSGGERARGTLGAPWGLGFECLEIVTPFGLCALKLVQGLSYVRPLYYSHM